MSRNSLGRHLICGGRMILIKGRPRGQATNQTDSGGCGLRNPTENIRQLLERMGLQKLIIAWEISQGPIQSLIVNNAILE
ncbi:hypothetical protein CEXT_35831 [Caerostris extrusa]|uniref:Uncharacterized protein n=1 Tax=Caerostris extrusa TaxID=172846 RepID=A0AAV4SWT1_CAEEX|nr:hypothetical protein CEXT_35831 [Caerostris extrusa]